MPDKATARQIAIEYSEEVRKALNPDKIILFGSYVDGKPHDESDIDIAVLITGVEGDDWYNARIKLQDIRWDEVKFFDIGPHLLDETHDPS